MQHPFPFDPTYGYDEQSLLKVPAPAGPADLQQFWQSTFDEAMRVPLNITRRSIASANENVDVQEIEFDAWGGARIGGWLTIPKERPIKRGIVIGHGYGGRGAPDIDPNPITSQVCIFPCARGFDRSKNPAIPSVAAGHVVHGIASRETYIHRGCVTDIWAAASVLLELFPQIAPCLDYIGVSFGGGIGAMALPWDHRFRRAMLGVPSFGNHPLRVQMQCVGSGESVRQIYLRDPGVLNVLAYFDSASIAKHLHIPTIASLALFDPAVPPPGQFAVYNAIPAKKECHISTAGHFEYPQQQQEYAVEQRRIAKWFALP